MSPSSAVLVSCSLDDLDSEVLRVVVPLVTSLIAVLGVCGNSLTLGAIVYARKNYPTEFTLLQLPVTDLLINLSVCDLVYCGFGLPHMVHGMLLGDSQFYIWKKMRMRSVQMFFTAIF